MNPVKTYCYSFFGFPSELVLNKSVNMLVWGIMHALIPYLQHGERRTEKSDQI